MTEYKLCETYKDGISFKMIHVTAKACGGTLRSVAYDMFLGRYRYDQLIDNVNTIIHFAGTNANTLWLVKYGFIEEVEIKIIYHLGQVFEGLARKKYLLSHVGEGYMALIELSGGNYFTKAIYVDHPSYITKEEFKKICGGRLDNFIEVENAAKK